MEKKMERPRIIRELAYEILKKNKKPIYYKELTKIIMRTREIKGKTPWNTVNSILHRSPIFKRMGKEKSGIFGLSEWGKRKIF
jgi:hypothetical protein